jgi:hypothetical protein
MANGDRLAANCRTAITNFSAESATSTAAIKLSIDSVVVIIPQVIERCFLSF